MSQNANFLKDPLHFPLHGSRLIEASAGTGKTYTIAALYVRLVLQHGCKQNAFHRELLTKNILVMTFTRAATAELADRIRTKLSEAASYFRNDNAISDDAFLLNLKNDYIQQGISSAELAHLSRRLELAAESMDESAVHTINGWCQKMLTEHAFDSGSLFEQEVKTEEDELRLVAAEEYFRRYVYSLDSELARQSIDIFGAPDILIGKIGRSLDGIPLKVSDYVSLATMFEQTKADAKAEVDSLKAKYRSANNVLAMIHNLPDHQNKGRKSAAKALQNWFDSAETTIENFDDKKFLTYDELVKKFKTDLPESAKVFRDLLTDVDKTKAITKGIDSALLQHASGFINARFQELKLQAAQLGFDDMLTRLRDALLGPNGQQLAKTIREQFPVALVDEFQDTDPVQYEIFDTIYRIEQNDVNTGIFLIGDPKQAIYSFRNADIFTYLKARKATAGRHYNLTKNFRSSQQMVDAVNRLFRIADEETKRGAFLFKQEIPFVEVEANGQRKVFKGLEGTEVAALHWHVANEPASKKDVYHKKAANFYANLIAKLLNSEKAGFYDGTERTPVTARDIAVLVANAAEARLIRSELRQRGIRSVYLSESDSVFSQPVAKDLLALLQACAQPRDPARVRMALAVPLLAESLTQLVEYQENELSWEAAVERFIGYHQIWEKNGVLAALLRLIHDFKVPGRLLADPREGERQLADTLHICELLQQESMRLEGMASLEEYFSLQVQEFQTLAGNEAGSSKRTNTDALQLRLESDEDLVKVITYHKSKGLQYPLVFIPFPAYTTEPQYRFKDNKFPQSYHKVNEQGQREKHIAWSKSDDEAMPLIMEEMLAEDIRKMYVALTRAEFATFVTLQAVGDPKHNPMFYLLYGDLPVDKTQTDVFEVACSCWKPNGIKDTEVSVMTTDEPEILQTAEIAQAALQARSFSEDLKRSSWWISSYSALSYGSELTTPDTPMQMNLLESAREETDSVVINTDNQVDVAPVQSLDKEKMFGESHDVARIHHLQKGATIGTFLHSVLEDAAEAGFSEVALNDMSRNSILDARCNNPFWQEHRATLDSWLQQYLQVRFALSDSDFALADLKVYKAEPEFWFETCQVSTLRMDELIAHYIQPGYARPKLDAITINGMLKGFIDLVFEHNGKYYVADYKSNWLGEHDDAYHLEAMRQKILASRYDLQYVIYTLALHKLLKARLGNDYDYDRHIGGAVYLFLRGHGAESRGAFFDRPPRQLIEALEREFLAQIVQGEAHA